MYNLHGRCCVVTVVAGVHPPPRGRVARRKLFSVPESTRIGEGGETSL